MNGRRKPLNCCPQPARQRAYPVGRMDEGAPPLDPQQARLRPTYATVSLSRLRANLDAIKAHVAPARVMAMLKANAYGHGLEAVARCLAPRADAFGVALVEEGIVLRRLGIDTDILVTGGTWTRQIPLFLEHRLTLTVPSLARLRDAEEAAAAAGTQGSGPSQDRHRHGAHRRPLLQRRAACSRPPPARRTCRSKASTPTSPTPTRTTSRTRACSSSASRRCCASTSGTAAGAAAPHGQLGGHPAAARDLVRPGAPGILLYGVYPHAGAPHTVEVRPALSWQSHVVYFKVVEPGTR